MMISTVPRTLEMMICCKLRLHLCLVLLVLNSMILVNSVSGVSDSDLDTAILALVQGGYNLFGNAIATSDLGDQILAGSNFTLFAPPDFYLQSLDMESTDTDYIQRLGCHVVRSRMTMSDFQDLTPNGSYFETLTIPHHRVLISNAQGPMSLGGFGFFNGGFVTVDGIKISAPDLYVGNFISVHGLASILPTDKDPDGVNHTSGDLQILAIPVSFPTLLPDPASNLTSSPDSSCSYSAATCGLKNERPAVVTMITDVADAYKWLKDILLAWKPLKFVIGAYLLGLAILKAMREPLEEIVKLRTMVPAVWRMMVRLITLPIVYCFPPQPEDDMRSDLLYPVYYDAEDHW